jgi:hypothetical protein
LLKEHGLAKGVVDDGSITYSCRRPGISSAIGITARMQAIAFKNDATDGDWLSESAEKMWPIPSLHRSAAGVTVVPLLLGQRPPRDGGALEALLWGIHAGRSHGILPTP